MYRSESFTFLYVIVYQNGCNGDYYLEYIYRGVRKMMTGKLTNDMNYKSETFPIEHGNCNYFKDNTLLYKL